MTGSISEAQREAETPPTPPLFPEFPESYGVFQWGSLYYPTIGGNFIRETYRDAPPLWPDKGEKLLSAYSLSAAIQQLKDIKHFVDNKTAEIPREKWHSDG